MASFQTGLLNLHLPGGIEKYDKNNSVMTDSVPPQRSSRIDSEYRSQLLLLEPVYSVNHNPTHKQMAFNKQFFHTRYSPTT